MVSIDKIAIIFSIAIVAAGVGFASYHGNVQDNAPVVSTPVVTKTVPAATAPQAQFGADIAAKVKQETSTEKPAAPVEKPAAPVEKPAGPQTVSVTIPTGTASPGCETTSECYLPDSVTINVGDSVEWTNVDTAAHTVTSGSPADGPSGAFDSSLIMGKAAFSHTFDKAGSYDYFCMVHPWMTGKVIVN